MTYALSSEGLALIQNHEGFRAEPAQLPDGNWVVGYSHVRVGGAGTAINESEAADLLVMDVAPFERLVNASVTQPLNQGQFDALVSFSFSIGAEPFAQSQVLRRVNTGEFVAAACAMDAWRKSDVSGETEIVDALVRRRAAEKALFLKDLQHEPAPSVFVRAKLDHAASILGAPVKYASAPAVGSVAVAVAKPDNVVVLREILKSEPATEALLLTQVVANDVEEVEEEIVTAHAKPVARPLENVREATRRAYAEQQDQAAENGRFPFFKNARTTIPVAVAGAKPDRRLRNMRRRSELTSKVASGLRGSFEHLALVALLLFGLGLLAVAGSLVVGSRDAIAIAGAAAVGTPGLAAALIAAFGLRRGAQAAPEPEAQPANA
jgi:GH24 family phage-related lysozyme (muramidase)